MRNRVRFVALALVSFVLAFLGSFLTSGAFPRRLLATALCSLLSFQSNACLAQLPRESERVVAAVSTPHTEKSGNNNDEQKVSVCVLGVCVNTPKIPIPQIPVPKIPAPTPNVPNGNSNGQSGANECELSQADKCEVDSQSKPVDLTGVWLTKGSNGTLSQQGCTRGYNGEVFINGKDDAPGTEVKVIQTGNRLIVPNLVIGGAHSESYTVTTQGRVCGNKIQTVSCGNTSLGRVTNLAKGTVSDDGNTVTGESLCKFTGGPATYTSPFTWTRKVSQFALTRATTTDAKNVTVDYTIGDSNSGESSQPIHFEIYRSSTEDADHAKEKIGEQNIRIGENDIPNSTNSSPGKHRVQLNLPVDSLKPNTAAPYVVVVATYNGKKSTTYFRKWMLGAISHGFNRYDQAGILWPFLREAGWLYSGDAFHPRLDPGGLPPWETNMAKSLKEYDKYDDVISFDWTKTCGLAQPDMAVQAGANLSKQITQWISTHRQHDGDVVDIHLIGHSRGTVVVTQALQHLSSASPSFEGGYIELTLLDPHPANNNLQRPWASFTRFTQDVSGIPAGYSAEKIEDKVLIFQDGANDPALNIPSGIKRIDIWYQHTEAICLTNAPDQEYLMNLWGLENTVIPNKNGMGIVMDFQDLTSSDKQHHCNQPAIGHNQVPDVYEKSVVETGTLNRSN